MANESLKKIFSNNLNYWLNERGKSQADLARQLNVSTATTSDWCNENKIPRTDKLVQISRWLMIELSDLIEEKKKEDVSEFDKILYRLKDDTDFYNLVSILNNLNNEKYDKIVDYITLLNK